LYASILFADVIDNCLVLLQSLHTKERAVKQTRELFSIKATAQIGTNNRVLIFNA
jgi:hypothetical protein